MPGFARLAVAGVVVLGVGLIAGHQLGSGGNDGPDRWSFRSEEVPAEFLYLDGARIVSYLAQIQGGVAPNEEISATETSASGLRLGADRGLAVEGDASTQRQLFTRRVVTPTETSNFLRLLTGLQDPKLQRPVRFRRLDARSDPADFAQGVAGLEEGDFVALENVRVLLPAYVQPYDAVSRLGSIQLLGAAGAKPIPAARSSAIRANLKRYARSVGPNPRVILNLGAHDALDGPPYARGAQQPPRGGKKRGEMPGCPWENWERLGGRWPYQSPPNARVLVPIQYGLLADEGSLFSGGHSRVVGKVVRVLREPVDGTRKPRRTDVCLEDPEVQNTFGLRAELLPARTKVNSVIGAIDRGRVMRSLDSDTRAIAPAAVVIPIAITKTTSDARGMP